MPSTCTLYMHMYMYMYTVHVHVHVYCMCAVSVVMLFIAQGNLQFREEEEKGIEVATITSRDLIDTIARLLAVEPDNLDQALCSRVIASRTEVVQKKHSVDQAYYSRDAFSKVRREGGKREGGRGGRGERERERERERTLEVIPTFTHRLCMTVYSPGS